MAEKCDKCGKSFGSEKALAQHMEDYDHSKGRGSSGVDLSINWKHAAGVGVLILFVLGGGVLAFREPETPTGDMIEDTDSEMTAYYDPDCGCCAEHARILGRDYDLEREITNVRSLHSMKEDLGIPRDLWSCHTTMVDDYFVEGHMPQEAIEKLLEEEPDIDGIALPGMPQGSPGMGGIKTEDWTIYSVDDGETSEFMVI